VIVRATSERKSGINRAQVKADKATMQNSTDLSPETTGRTGRIWWYWLPVAAYAGLIFYLSSLSQPEEYVPSLLAELGDKVLHAMEFGMLGILCYRAFRHAAGAWAAHYALFLAVAASVGYALTDEVHQAFVPLREPDAWDLLADSIGASIAAFGWRWMDEP
jgi:VanZ family protein